MIRRVLFAVTSALAPSLAWAAEFKTGDVSISDPAVRATPGGAKVGAGYLTIRTSGASPDRLVRVESSAAARVDLHTTSHEGDVMRMHEREGGLALPPGSEVRRRCERGVLPMGRHASTSGSSAAPLRVR